MEAIVNPESRPPVQQQARLPQDGEVARDLGLGQIQGYREIADATLTDRQEEHEDAQSGEIGKGVGQVFRGKGHVGRLGGLDQWGNCATRGRLTQWVEGAAGQIHAGKTDG